MKSVSFGHMKSVLTSAIDARKLLPFAFILMLAFLVVMAWDGYASTRELLSAQGFVEHTHQVLHEMDGVEDGLQDAREAWLHYVLTPEKQDLVDFDAAVEQVVKRLYGVENKIQDDPAKLNYIKQLRVWINDELSQLRQYMRTQRTKLIYHSLETDEKRDRVRNAIQKFKDDQERLLRERNQAAQERARQITRNVLIRIGAFSALMGALFAVVMRESKKLRIAEQTALLAQNNLEGSLLQLQSETENSKLLNEVQADLQICANAEEAYRVTAAYLQKLMRASAGTVFAVDGTRNQMSIGATWGGQEHLPVRAYSADDCCAVRGGRPHSHLEETCGLVCRHFAGEGPKAYICFPLSALGETLSLLHVSADNPAHFTPSRIALIQQIGEYTALRLANLKLREKLQDQSIRDPLTGLYNRRFLETTLEQQLRRTGESQAGTGIIMADIDGFKAFNDSFGHEAGDYVLKEVGALLRRSVRGEDIVCRYGGEEFLTVIPDSSPESVCERAELMRTAISRLQLEHAGRPLGKVTASFGISFSQDGSLTSEMLLRHADEALYIAKRSGCDCVRLSDSVASLLDAAKEHGKEEIEEPGEPSPMRPKSATAAKRA
ncbi:MAG TPA: diguanylate cyclase [Candidatus Angelobacter sp.]